MAIPPDLSAYKSFIEEGQAGYENPYGQLGMVDPGIRYDPRQQSWGSDVYAYHLGGGRGAGDVTPAGIMTQAAGTTDLGTGEAGITAAGVATPSVGAQTPLTQMITTPTGETMTVKEAMTQPEAYDIPGTMPLTPVSGAWGPQEQFQEPTLPTDYEWEAAQMGQPTITPEAALEDWASPMGDIPDAPIGVTDKPLPREYELSPGALGGALPPTDYEWEAAQMGQPPITSEAKNAWQKVQSGLASAGDFIQNYGMATYNFLAGNTMAGLAGLAAGPLGLGLTAAAGALQTTPEQKTNMSAAQTTGIADPNDPRKDIYGTNIVSAFGDYEQSLEDSIATLEESGANPEKKEKLQETLDIIQTGKIEEAPTDIVKPGDIDFAQERTPENIAKATEDLADQYDREVEAGERTSDPTVTSNINKAKAVVDMPQMLGDVGGGRDEPSPGRAEPSAPTGISGPPSRGGTATTGPSAPPSMGGGGGNGGNGGGKIVCTMMNDSYGFGSFRNKIWLRQSKNLAPEYQIGYHKIFLPLVKLSKKNIVLKKILEHIAIHRTIDIRQEARGKTHILGRIYRKVLEPICYWVGKYGKRT